MARRPWLNGEVVWLAPAQPMIPPSVLPVPSPARGVQAAFPRPALHSTPRAEVHRTVHLAHRARHLPELRQKSNEDDLGLALPSQQS